MVVFRIAPDEHLASLTRRTHIAFEIDQIEEGRRKAGVSSSWASGNASPSPTP